MPHSWRMFIFISGLVLRLVVAAGLILSCVSYCGSCGFCLVMQSSPGGEALFVGLMGTHLQSDFYWGYSEVQIPVNTGTTAVTWAAVFTRSWEFLQIYFLPVSSWVCHRLVGLG